jgi:hypothetical protein
MLKQELVGLVPAGLSLRVFDNGPLELPLGLFHGYLLVQDLILGRR